MAKSADHTDGVHYVPLLPWIFLAPNSFDQPILGNQEFLWFAADFVNIVPEVQCLQQKPDLISALGIFSLLIFQDLIHLVVKCVVMQ